MTCVLLLCGHHSVSDVHFWLLALYILFYITLYKQGWDCGRCGKSIKYLILFNICDKPTFFCSSLVKSELMWLRPAGA